MSRTTPEIADIYHSWYGSGEKRIPEEFSLDPLSLRLWFVDDGNVRDRNPGVWTPQVKIAANNWMDQPSMLESLFDDIGFNIHVRGHKIHIPASETEQFFDYIGAPLPGFSYKFPEDLGPGYTLSQARCENLPDQ